MFADGSLHLDIRQVKVISERDECSMVNRVTQHFQETSAPAWGGAESKESNHPCVNASTLTMLTFRDFNTFPEQKQTDTLYILLLIGCVIEIKLCDLVGVTVLNNGFELEYNFDCDVLSSPAIDAIGVIPHMPASNCNFNTSGVGLGEFDIANYNLDVVFPAAIIAIENEIEIKYGSLTSHSQIHTNTTSTVTVLTVPNDFANCLETEVQACELCSLNMNAYNTGIDYIKQMFFMELILQYKIFSENNSPKFVFVVDNNRNVVNGIRGIVFLNHYFRTTTRFLLINIACDT